MSWVRFPSPAPVDSPTAVCFGAAPEIAGAGAHVFIGFHAPSIARSGAAGEGESEYIRNCFEEYKVVTDPGGRYMCSYKKWHLIGLELGISVASIALRGEPTGVATCFNADIAATAKKNLQPGEALDGEGGYTVFGKLTPARTSLAKGYLPLGLAHNVRLKRPVARDACVTWDDVEIDACAPAVRLRREQEAVFAVSTSRA
jgi:predicted homoserine dehydrogenase-like protein